MERFFHAPGRGAYFEGWYFKLQTRGGEALALIPALHQDAALRRSASLQVITREGSWWLEYPEAEFGASAPRRLGCASARGRTSSRRRACA